jgi:NAD(P)-dependent dehydrogenase (short-subunit alcohol dehydrogenase family)
LIEELLNESTAIHIWTVSSQVSKVRDLAVDTNCISRISFINVNWEDWTSADKLLSLELENISFDEIYIFCGVQGSPKSGSYGSLSEENASQVFLANAFLPSKILEFLSNNLRQVKAKIFVMSSRSGSISERGTLKHHTTGGNAIYRASKAGLNMMIKCFAYDHSHGPHVYLIHPGFVKSSSNQAPNAVHSGQFAAQMRDLVRAIDSYESGSFIDLTTLQLISP